MHSTLDILARPVYQTGHIRELRTNPLLLTILCIVFHEKRKLPTGRAELYAHCVRVLLEYWRQDLYESELGTRVKPYDAEAAQAVLARVAWWMHQEQDRTAAPFEELAGEAAKGLAEVAASSGLGRDGFAFIDRMRNESGILAMAGEGEGRCGFLHLSFQEYLAAEHAGRESLAQPLASRATESWWREVALLSLRRSRPFCEAFFGEMLKAGIAENHPDLAERTASGSSRRSASTPWAFAWPQFGPEGQPVRDGPSGERSLERRPTGWKGGAPPRRAAAEGGAAGRSDSAAFPRYFWASVGVRGRNGRDTT